MNRIFALLLALVFFLCLWPAVGIPKCVLGDCENGEGTEVMPDNSRYVGEWLAGQRSGRGIMGFVDGDSYDGEWRDDLPHGEGVFRSHEGDVYSGQFKRGVRHGRGILILASGNRYEGEWQNDMPHGRGVLTYPDGSSYSGEFQNGMRHGRGAVEFADGRRFIGVWRDGAQDSSDSINTYEWERGGQDEAKEDSMPGPSAKEQYLYASVSGDRVNIRSGPGMNYKVVNNVRKGMPLRVVSLEGQWARVADWKENDGWIYAAFLGSNMSRVVTVVRANIRSGPGTAYPVRAALNYREIFVPGEEEAGWIQVKDREGTIGWVSRELVWPR